MPQACGLHAACHPDRDYDQRDCAESNGKSAQDGFQPYRTGQPDARQRAPFDQAYPGEHARQRWREGAVREEGFDPSDLFQRGPVLGSFRVFDGPLYGFPRIGLAIEVGHQHVENCTGSTSIEARLRASEVQRIGADGRR